jgi:hypothetical protein
MAAALGRSASPRCPDVDSPVGIVPTAAYTREQVCAALGIGDTKLRELVREGDLHPLIFTTRWRFFGEDLIRMCRDAADYGGVHS